MKQPSIMVLGGCHVAGHAISPDDAFPKLLGDLLDGAIVGQVSYLQFVHLPEHLAATSVPYPSHVVLQLGNHEFSASYRSLGRQLYRAMGIQPSSKKPLVPSSSLPSPASKDIQSSSEKTLSNTAHSMSGVGPALPASRPAYYARVMVTGLFTAALWVFSARHRRSFQALSSCMRQHPDTMFIFLSPFPCFVSADNALRDFGGWVFRQLLADLPNRYWLDSHRLLLCPDHQVFIDKWHLNEAGHRVLAHGIAALILDNIACCAPNGEEIYYTT